MSDRDKKLIMIILILAIGLLPYFFYIKDKRVETESILNENIELQVRYDELQAMNENRQFYLDEIERYNKEMLAIIDKYPSDIRPENYTMFLLQAEYSSLDYAVDEETGDFIYDENGEKVPVWVYPFRFVDVTYTDNIETPIEATDVEVDGTSTESVEVVETGYVALTNTSTLRYSCRYDALKYMLGYIMDYVDPMTYRTIDMSFDDETGIIEGQLILSQYAVNGPDREFKPVEFKQKYASGIERDYGIDALDMRGNEEVGIFGPYNLKILVEGEVEEGEGGENAEANADAGAEETTETTEE